MISQVIVVVYVCVLVYVAGKLTLFLQGTRNVHDHFNVTHRVCAFALMVARIHATNIAVQLLLSGVEVLGTGIFLYLAHCVVRPPCRDVCLHMS